MRAGRSRARAARRRLRVVGRGALHCYLRGSWVRGTWVAWSRWRERVGGSDEGEKIVMSSSSPQGAEKNYGKLMASAAIFGNFS